MLVTCGECGVGFDHAMQRCVACGTEYQPSGEEKLTVLQRDAEAWLRERLDRPTVLRRLTEERDASELEADAALKAARQVLRSESRRQGAYIVSSGLLLLLIALGVYLLSFGFRLQIGLLAFGGTMVVLGMLKVVTGWNLTGRDDD